MLKTFQLHSRTDSAWLRIGHRALQGALGLGVGISLWSLVQTLHPAVSVPQKAVSAIAPPSRALDLQSAGRIFGAYTPPISVVPVSASDDVKLIGVIVADDPSASLAILEVDGKELSLTVGASLPDGETLKSVSPQSVILARGTEERMLQWEMQGVSTDAVFSTLPYGQGELIAAALPAQVTIKGTPATPAAVQLMELRQAALQVLAKRAQAKTPPAGEKH